MHLQIEVEEVIFELFIGLLRLCYFHRTVLHLFQRLLRQLDYRRLFVDISQSLALFYGQFWLDDVDFVLDGLLRQNWFFVNLFLFEVGFGYS